MALENSMNAEIARLSFQKHRIPPMQAENATE